VPHGEKAPPNQALKQIMNDLLEATSASRTTLRLDWPRWGAHVDDVFAEARQPGIESLVGKTSIRQREAETVKWLGRTKGILAQEDCARATPSPPLALLDVYGVRAQMLAPLVLKDSLVGWISVHENRSPREWTQKEIQVLETAAAAAKNMLDEGNAPSGGGSEQRS